MGLCYDFWVRENTKGNLMKKVLLGFAVLALLCQATASYAFGIYEDTTEPVRLSTQANSSCKVGTATGKSYLGIVNLGDCSYEAAMRNGKITQVHHHDKETKGWFFYKQITTKVYGE